MTAWANPAGPGAAAPGRVSLNLSVTVVITVTRDGLASLYIATSRTPGAIGAGFRHSGLAVTDTGPRSWSDSESRPRSRRPGRQVAGLAVAGPDRGPTY